MSVTAFEQLHGQSSVTAGVAAHAERSPHEGAPLQHPSLLTAGEHVQQYRDEVDDFLSRHPRESNESQASTLSPVHVEQHHTLVDSTIPNFSKRRFGEDLSPQNAYDTMGEALEIGYELVANTSVLQTIEAEPTSKSKELDVMLEVVAADQNIYAAGKSLAENFTRAEELVDFALTEAADDWQRAGLSVCLDMAANVKSAESGSWFSETDQQAEDDLTNFTELRDKIAPKHENRPINTEAVKATLRTYKGISEAGVSFYDAYTYKNLQPYTGNREFTEPPTAKEVIDTVAAYKNAGPTVKKVLHDGEYSGQYAPHKFLKLSPLIEKLPQQPETKEPEEKHVKQLAELVGCSLADTNEASSARQKVVEMFLDGEVPLDNVLSLVRTKSNADKIAECQATAETDEQSAKSLQLLTAVAKLPLFQAVDHDNYYANGQGQESDVRDSVIATILSNPDGIAPHATMLLEKVPALIESGFPINLVAKSLLDEFNSSIAVNMHDKTYYAKKIDYCNQIGASIVPINEYDPQLAEYIVDGQYYEIVRADIPPDTAKIQLLGQELAYIKDQGTPVEAWLQDFSRPELEGVDAVLNLVTIGRRLAADPDLSTLAFSKSPDTTYQTYEANGMRRAVTSLKSFDQIESFFGNCDIARSVLQDGRLDRGGLLEQLATMEPENVRLVVNQLRDPSVLAGLADESLRAQINRTTLLVGMSPDTVDLTRGLEVYRGLENNQYYSLFSVVMAGEDVKKNTPAGWDETFYAVLNKAASMHDKNGNPYESARSISGVIRNLVPNKFYSAEQQSQVQDTLSWYAQDAMPYVALPTISVMRESAAKAGVGDKPREIYNWMFGDPTRIQETSSIHLQNYANKLKADTGKVEEAKQQAEQRIANFAVFVNLSEAALVGIATESDGAVKSLMDKVEMKERGAEYDLFRSETEIGLGLRSLDETIEHPTYGSCGFTDKEIPAGALGYGDILLTFPMTDDLKSRTTFTPEDSFNGATRLTAGDAMTLRVLKDNLGLGYTNTQDYVESQVAAGTNLREASQIVVPDEVHKARLIASLPQEYHAKIVIRQLIRP